MSNVWHQRVVVVTGASRGIGASTCIGLANKGAVVIGLSRQIAKIDDLNREITGSGKIHARHCDLTDSHSICEAFQWVKENFGPLSILVCNAGSIKANFIIESPTEDLKQLIDTNVLGTACCLREGLKLMRDSQVKGHIIVVNSILGHRIPEVPVPLFSIYPATKHAITALCQTIRQEIHFLKLNIKLTSLSPGLVNTEFLKVYSHAVDELPKMQPQDVTKAILYVLDTPDYLQVEDIQMQAMRRYDSK